MQHMRDRLAVITGGGGGIGRAMALRFAREGARVVVADVDTAGMQETVQRITDMAGQALAVRTDVSQRDQVEQLAVQAQEAFGPVHILCNNAGVAVWGGVEAATYQDWQWVMGVNLWGVIHGLQAFLPGMLAHGQEGHIVNTASMAGLIASQGLGIYNTTKYAVVGLSETLAKDLRASKIGVSVLCPMAVDTRINDSARNRPAALQNPAGHVQAEAIALFGQTLSPEDVAEQVVAAVRTKQLYIITHAEGIEPLRRRFARIERSVQGRKGNWH